MNHLSADARFRFQCPQCDTRLKMKPGISGKTISCPNCRFSFQAPLVSQVEPPPFVQNEFHIDTSRVSRRIPRRSRQKFNPAYLFVGVTILAVLALGIGYFRSGYSVVETSLDPDKRRIISYLKENLGDPSSLEIIRWVDRGKWKPPKRFPSDPHSELWRECFHFVNYGKPYNGKTYMRVKWRAGHRVQEMTFIFVSSDETIVTSLKSG